MSEVEKNLEIATFRFGIIAEFVTGVKLSYGEKEKLLQEKSSRNYNMPHSNRSVISRSTIISWVYDYKNAGHRIEGLYPKERKDKGVYKSLDSTLRIAIKNMKKTNPRFTVPTIVKKLKHQKLIPMDEIINYRSVYNYLKREKLTNINEDAVDKRHFEAIAPNEIWQSDVMHGPRALINGVNRKTYLCAILDDHSRMIMHAEFYSSETLENLKDCLKKSIKRRGLPQKFYVDNGACYRALNLEQITACLGIALKHARPYMPQGKGKIERWFRNVRDNFLPFYTSVKDLSALNEQLDLWVDDYNNREHTTTKTTPLKRYIKNLECVRPAPPNLLDYFRMIDFRRVKNDRTFKLKGVLYEAPVQLIGKKIELRYHEDDTTQLEVFFNNQSFGFVTLVDPHVNARIGRNWSSTKNVQVEKEILKNKNIKSGTLF
jgi:putative transposase